MSLCKMLHQNNHNNASSLSFPAPTTRGERFCGFCCQTKKFVANKLSNGKLIVSGGNGQPVLHQVTFVRNLYLSFVVIISLFDVHDTVPNLVRVDAVSLFGLSYREVQEPKFGAETVVDEHLTTVLEHVNIFQFAAIDEGGPREFPVHEFANHVTFPSLAMTA